LISELVEEVARGQGRVVFIEGDPGVGKTRLIGECASTAERRGLRIFRSSCLELERERPFGVLLDALGCTRGSSDPGRARVAEIVLGTTAGSDIRFRVVEDLGDLLEHEAIQTPVALVVDDIHWIDASSALAIGRIAQRLATLPSLILLAARKAPRPGHLTELLDALATVAVVRADLMPLSRDDARAMADALLGAEPSAALITELEAAGGNPLFLCELIGSLADEDAIEVHDGVANVERHVEPPPSLRLTILRRLSTLDRDTLDTLRQASILGSTLRLTDLAAITGRSTRDLTAVVTEAIRAGWLLDAGDVLRFRHDVVREALYLDFPEATRASLHTDVARALVQASAPIQRIAAHFAMGAQPGDHEAIDWLHRAGRELAAKDPAAALDLLERASSLAGDSAARQEIEADMLFPLSWTGRFAEAERRCRRLLESDDLKVAIEAARALTTTYWVTNRLDEMYEVSEFVLRLPDLMPEQRAEFMTFAGNRHFFNLDPAAALECADEILAAGKEANEPFAIGVAFLLRGLVARWQGDFAAASQNNAVYVEEQRKGLGRGGRPREPLLGNALMFSAWNKLSADDVDAGEALIREAFDLYDQVGAVTYRGHCHRGLAHVNYLKGAWDDAIAEAATAVQLLPEAWVGGLSVYQRDARPLIYLHQGELAEARSLVGRILDRSPGRAPVADLWTLPTLGLVCAAEGKPDESLAAFGRAFATCAGRDVVMDIRWFGPEAVRIARGSGRTDIIDAVLGNAKILVDRSGLASARGAALHCRGITNGDIDALVEAVGLLRQAPDKLLLAQACVDAGTAFAQVDKDRGVALLQEARGLFEALGATADIPQIDAALRTHGVKAGVRATRRRAKTGWDSLTDTELRVVGLLTEGLSNPEIGGRLFISRRTVATHLSSVFRKLDVSSRVELSALAARRLG
jgi:DNA-binding CsgD family transcriptional regulator/tetratricopeptide (TPR) repeat protein